MADGANWKDRRTASHFRITPGELIEMKTAGLKWCSKCGLWHPISYFGPDKTNADGLRPYCHQSQRVKVKRYVASYGHKGKRHKESTRNGMSIARSGSGNANWKGGVTPAIRKYRQNVRYQAWRSAVLIRDGQTCRRCGASPKIVHAHHIKPFHTHPLLVLDLDNGLTVCPPCHRDIHKEKAIG